MEGKSLFKDHLVSFDEFPAGHDTPQVPPDDDDDDTGDDDPEEGQDDDPADPPDKGEGDDADDDGEGDDEPEDDQAKGFYEYLTSKGLIEAQEGFKPTVKNLEQLLDSLPEQYFIEAVSGVHNDAQQLLQYAFHLGENASIAELTKFFDQYMRQDAPANLEDEQEAYNYLQRELKSNKAFPTEAKLTSYLDSLLDDGSLIPTAKQMEAERDQLRTQQRAAAVQQAAEEAKKAEEEMKAYYSNLYEMVQKQPWEKDRKEAVLKNLDPAEAGRKNQLISQSPEALLQLADVFSRFDEKTGKFDLSDFGVKKKDKEAKAAKAALEKDGLRSILDKVTTGQKDNKSGKSGSFWTDFREIND